MSDDSFFIFSNLGSISNILEIGARILPAQKLSDDIFGLRITRTQHTQTLLRTSNVPRNVLPDRPTKLFASDCSTNITCRPTFYSSSGSICESNAPILKQKQKLYRRIRTGPLRALVQSVWSKNDGRWETGGAGCILHFVRLVQERPVHYNTADREKRHRPQMVCFPICHPRKRPNYIPVVPLD